MNNENKHLILDTLRTTSGLIDKITYYQYVGGGVLSLVTSAAKDVTWGAAADGKLTMTTPLDFENSGSSDISGITGFALYNSSATTLLTTDDAVKIWPLPSGAVTLEVGEILRCATAEYTIN
jgi:hypothetical protein